jgi:hypothetical protein
MLFGQRLPSLKVVGLKLFDLCGLRLFVQILFGQMLFGLRLPGLRLPARKLLDRRLLDQKLRDQKLSAQKLSAQKLFGQRLFDQILPSTKTIFLTNVIGDRTLLGKRTPSTIYSMTMTMTTTTVNGHISLRNSTWSLKSAEALAFVTDSAEMEEPKNSIKHSTSPLLKIRT